MGGPKGVASIQPPARVSVLIVAKNEEHNLRACLESVAWADDVHLYDSMSTDRTVEIAESLGVKVTQKGFDDPTIAFGGDEASHRNWGLNNIPFKYPWVLQLDADERCNPALVAEIDRVVGSSPHSAYRIRRRDYFMGTWLKHVQATPYYLRLFMPKKVHYERLINSTLEVDGTIGQLSSYFDHFPFSKGVGQWVEKHNHYSTLEAREVFSSRGSGDGSMWKGIFASDFHTRRYWQKRLFYRLPFRPALKFFLLYVAKRGFLDGRAGLAYASLQSYYEYLIQLKTRELQM
jgi:glycosyltransferase involved in cell wall biosynthesis